MGQTSLQSVYRKVTSEGPPFKSVSETGLPDSSVSEKSAKGTFGGISEPWYPPSGEVSGLRVTAQIAIPDRTSPMAAIKTSFVRLENTHAA